MKYYDYINFPNDIPKHAGKYVDEHNDAYEKNNFHIWDDGFCYGFVETGHYKGSKPRKLNIDNITNGHNEEFVEGVTIVFCALSDIQRKTVIVGWYNNATVYRNRQFTSCNHMYNLKVKREDVVLLNELDRLYHVPRARKDGVGFGQSQVWYATSENAQEFKKWVLNYIEGYIKKLELSFFSGDGEIECEDLVYYENASGKECTVKQYERNQTARNICLRLKGTRCAICDFSFAETYGKDFENTIEIHHIKPISEQSGKYKVAPKTDLIPLCPNCHTAIHKKINGRELSVAELKEVFNHLSRNKKEIKMT